MQGEIARMQSYQVLMKETFDGLKREHSSKSTKVRVDAPADKASDNPNLYITGT